MYNGKCNGCGQQTDVIRGIGSCGDCATDEHNANAAALRVVAVQKRNARYLANKKRRAPDGRS